MRTCRLVCWSMTISLGIFVADRLCDAAPTAPSAAMTPVGVAKVDITPDGPIRLTGYASRKTESEGAAMRIWAKALAIGDDAGEGPAVLMMVENCGVPGSLTADVAGRLRAKAGVKPERFLVCSTHTHAGPWLLGFAPALLSESLPAEHRAHMEQYQRQLADKMEQAALAALAARKPARLAWAEGTVKFAMNRRPIKDGRCPGLGVNAAGPVDHSLPLLCASDAQGKVFAIVVNYACHCTTIGGDFNQIHGDWAGMTQQYIEAEHPGATALVCIGCGADANPDPRGKADMTGPHGRAVADEVNRLLKGKLTPLSPRLVARRLPLQLPLDDLPTRKELQQRVEAAGKPKATAAEKRAAARATTLLAELDAGRPLPTSVDYSVTAWSFGNDLAMVFLPGEVVVDYALRLKREFDAARLWISAYTNDVPCYIVSRRVLREGGYEPDTSMIYYGKPTQLSPVVEDRIVDTAKALVPKSFLGGAGKAAGPCVWKAGVATVKVTPQTPLWMAGYASRTKPSEGIAQDLFAKALAIEDAQGSRAVLVTIDLIGVDRTMRDAVANQMQRKHGLEPRALLLNVSHTHCGPEFGGEDLSLMKIDPALRDAGFKYRAELQEKLCAVVGEALGRLAPAQLDYLHAWCGFAMNRRRPMPNGFQNAPYSDGPVDHNVPVLRVTDAAGKLRAVLFGYACHNTCMSDNLFRGDYAGYAQEYFEQANPGATAMFLMGCGGDPNPWPRRTEGLTRAHGRSLAPAVEAALLTVPRRLVGPLRTALDDAILDFAPPPSREELQQIAATKKRPTADHAEQLLKELDEKGKIRAQYPCPVQVIRFGADLTLVAIAGETVVDYSLRLKRELAGPAVWVAGYSNDVFGYLPSQRVLKEGGYEAADAALWGTLPGAFAPTLEERVIAKACQLAQ
jgi:neutral ceramidase